MTGSLQNRRVWLVGGVIAAVLIALAAWFLAISPELSSASSLQGQTANANVLNDTIRIKNAKLEKQYSQIHTLKAELTSALLALPSDSGLPDFTRELAGSATASAVDLTSITVGGIAAYAAAPTTTATTPDSTTPSSTPAPAVTTTPTPAAAGQYTITVTVTTAGSLTHQTAFVNALRNGPRRVLIGSTQLTIAATSRIASVDAGTTMTTQLTIFSAPMTTAQVAELQKINGH